MIFKLGNSDPPTWQSVWFFFLVSTIIYRFKTQNKAIIHDVMANVVGIFSQKYLLMEQLIDLPCTNLQKWRYSLYSASICRHFKRPYLVTCQHWPQTEHLIQSDPYIWCEPISSKSNHTGISIYHGHQYMHQFCSWMWLWWWCFLRRTQEADFAFDRWWRISGNSTSQFR